ncbi:MAG TPA: O-antigen ligase family protein, partial [Myxococcales bacterium]|nr:O-antigen ligase family protein [Myxococcales bacterium]
GNPGAALAPTLGVGVLWLMWRIPIRYSLFVLIFLGLTLECAQEIPASGLWKSPFFIFGEMLLSKANDWTGVKPLVFTGVDLVVGYLLLIMVWRRATGSRIDTEGQEPTAGAMALGAAITLAGTLWVWGYGLARGGNFGNSLLQIYKLLYVPLLFFLCQAAFRGPKDHWAIAKVMLGAVLFRSLFACFVRYVIGPTLPIELAYATTHGDSMLFASGAGLALAMLNEGVARDSKQLKVFLIALIGIVVVGAKANNRRVAWVEMAFLVFAFWMISDRTPLKRFVARSCMIAAPIIIMYLGVGWNSSGSGIFTPVRLARSILDSKSDSSTLWRDLENADLIMNIQENPILGTGLGHEYNEFITLPDVSAAFKLYRLIPHNSVLGFLAFAGVLGFTVIWCAIAVAVFMASRAYGKATVPLDRALALWVIGVMIVYINSIYGDMGQGSWTAVFCVCPAMAVAGKLPIPVGAWPRRMRKAVPTP